MNKKVLPVNQRKGKEKRTHGRDGWRKEIGRSKKRSQSYKSTGDGNVEKSRKRHGTTAS